jgi:SAM-dependent methyltransferase
MSELSCPLCGGADLSQVLTLRNIPVICNQLWPDVVAAKTAPTGDVELVMCETCALIWNRAFEPRRMAYAPGYENALHFSPKFQAFAEKLAEGLVDRHGLAGRHVIEIGCGDGYLLDLMVKHGVKTAVGFDPSMASKTTPYAARPGVEIVPEYFRPDHLGRPFDFILCRHVLEHLDDPRLFLTDIRRAIGGRNVPIYFEVPNASWMLDAVSVWDLIYEHVTYWTAPTMMTLFWRTGFAPVNVQDDYGAQFLMLEAKPAKAEACYLSPQTDTVKAAAHSFTVAANDELAKWRHRLAALKGKAVIWGAGSKGITFANVLAGAGRPLAALVDLNPRKNGLLAPGVALPVVAPDELRQIRPNLVLVSNVLYETEIAAQVKSMELEASIEVIAG